MSDELNPRPEDMALDVPALLAWCTGSGVSLHRSTQTIAALCRRLLASDLALKDALVRAAAAEAECGRWRLHRAAQDRGHHDRMAGVPEGACPYPVPADAEGETSERAWWGIGWRDADAQLRLAGAEAEAKRLGLELVGKQKAFDLLLAGMESQAEQMHELKQRVRELEAGRKGGAP